MIRIVPHGPTGYFAKRSCGNLQPKTLVRALPNDEQRLELLNQSQPDRPWRSCSEKRRCVVCDTVFSGDETIVRWSRQRQIRLACPKCGSGPALWVRLGNPLIDEETWADWESAMRLASADGLDESENDFAAVN